MIIDAVKASNALTIEAWAKPANNTQAGPARIVTLSNGSLNRNFTLGQQNATYAVRVRTNDAGVTNNGIPTIETGTVQTNLAQHIVYTWDNSNGVEKVYQDGVEVYSGTRAGNTSNWSDTYKLAIGNEFGGGRGWLGEIYTLAIYDKAFASSEVTNNYNEGYCCTEVTPETNCPTGSISFERFTGISGSLLSDLTGSADYPNNPAETGVFTSLQGPTSYSDNYGTRVRGYLHPTETGDYVFTVTSDDGSEVYLSTDKNPNKTIY